VSFKPLDRGAVEQALRQRDCPGCPPPAPLGAGPQFPPPQQLGEGEALTLELLANAGTGERILDVVLLSAKPIDGVAMRAAAGSALEGQQALRRAAALVARGQFSAAAEEYRRALTLQPNDASAHNKLGICYQRLQNDAMARREYEKALELHTGYAEVWNNIGTLEQSRRRFKPAVRAYKKAIDLKPALATPWKNLGNAYLALGQVQEAFEAYQEAFRLDPTILESQDASSVPAAGVDLATHNFVIAKLLAQGGHKDAALDFLRRAREAGFRDFARVQSDEAFRSLLQDPRFKDLVAGR
jgi:tetratricopeptide (TPR) repeat protein